MTKAPEHPLIYDILTDTTRLATQEDVNRLQQGCNVLGKLRRLLRILAERPPTPDFNPDAWLDQYSLLISGMTNVWEKREADRRKDMMVARQDTDTPA